MSVLPSITLSLGFLTLIRPLQSAIDAGTVNTDWLGESVTITGKTWYKPTQTFWTVHCNAAHAPEGDGCNATLHTALLTHKGSNAEFEYCNMMKDGSVIIQKAKEFEEECKWWSKNFHLIETMGESPVAHTVKSSCRNHNIVIALLIAYVVFDLSSGVVMSKGITTQQRKSLFADFKIGDFLGPLIIAVLVGWGVWWWLNRK